jgi:DNA-binding NarL/FixJ family response regulator
MLTVSDSADDLFGSLQSGAVGYLLKDIPSSEVPITVHNALAGRDGVLTARVLEEFRLGRGRITEATSTEGHRVRFTPREVEVLALLLDDLSTSDIATRLFVRPITVRRHIADAMHKLRVGSRAEALALLRGQANPDQ